MRQAVLIFLSLLILLSPDFPEQQSCMHAAAVPKTSQRRKKNVARQTNVSAPKTSAEAKRRQEATRKEIKLTEEQIKENEKSVRNGLNELGRLETDIASSQKTIKATTARITALDVRIDTLERGISGNEKELERLREEYLKAVKKMRIAKKNGSDLAFIFASDNFNQALRRMRYLRQFSKWKDRQSDAIIEKNKELTLQKSQLSAAKTEQNEALRKQRKEEELLRDRHARQNVIVDQLKQNGEDLKSHLAKKQKEADVLRGQIARLIAAEEAKRLEEERKAAERKAAEEKAKKEEELRLAEEKRLREEREKSQPEELEKESSVQKDSKKDKSKKENPKKDAGKNYADARKRTPRGNVESASKPSVAGEASIPKTGGNFASMKGNLPKPVSGSFKITSRFGRQSLPDLPDVVYDNPGIDAEVDTGAIALSVYEGKVSGVYMLPGYNTVVIVNHGAYYTVYGNIGTPRVKVGDTVKSGQGLGVLASDVDDSSRSCIHFEVWKSREKLNPLEWIK